MKSPLDRFPLASADVKPRLIWAGWGPIGSGKTHFALGAPGPMLVQSFDKGLEGVVEGFRKDGKDIRVVEYDWSPQQQGLDQRDPELQRLAIDVRDKFIADFEYALPHVRTIIIDRESDLWEVVRYAQWGAPSDQPKNYALLYQKYRYLLGKVKASDINFGCTQGTKIAWDRGAVNPKTGKAPGVKTDRIERWGCDELDGLVHIDLHHRREDGHFYIDVGKSRGPGGQDVQDQSFMDFSFTDLAMMIFPDTSEADWQ